MSIIIQNIIIKIFKVIFIPNCLIFDLNNFIRLFQLLLIIRMVLKLPILLLLSAYDLTKIELYRMSQEIKHCIRFIEIKTRKIKKKKEMENYRRLSCKIIQVMNAYYITVYLVPLIVRVSNYPCHYRKVLCV